MAAYFVWKNSDVRTVSAASPAEAAKFFLSLYELPSIVAPRPEESDDPACFAQPIEDGATGPRLDHPVMRFWRPS